MIFFLQTVLKWIYLEELYATKKDQNLGGGGIYANYSKRKKGSNNSLKTVARGIKLNIIEIWIKKKLWIKQNLKFVKKRGE